MSAGHPALHPTATAAGPARPQGSPGAGAPPTQRELVIASLLRCPGEGASSKRRKTA